MFFFGLLKETMFSYLKLVLVRCEVGKDTSYPSVEKHEAASYMLLVCIIKPLVLCVRTGTWFPILSPYKKKLIGKLRSLNL